MAVFITLDAFDVRQFDHPEMVSDRAGRGPGVEVHVLVALGDPSQCTCPVDDDVERTLDVGILERHFPEGPVPWIVLADSRGEPTEDAGRAVRSVSGE